MKKYLFFLIISVSFLKAEEIIYQYGLTETQFNFLSGLTGLLTAVLLVFVIYRKV